MFVRLGCIVLNTERLRPALQPTWPDPFKVERIINYTIPATRKEGGQHFCGTFQFEVAE